MPEKLLPLRNVESDFQELIHTRRAVFDYHTPRVNGHSRSCPEPCLDSKSMK